MKGHQAGKEVRVTVDSGGLEEAHQCADVEEATLEWERAAFEEEKECLEDNLDQALAAKDAVEAHVHTVVD